ncbi:MULTISPECIES: ATP-binding protein [Aeromonas]|uniref:ATP-binding protein n=1 Tax=Aeromonas caviae TaxID=648 RepID=A0AAJ5ZD67_AERCA|nr:ATP-binding protein [Aeromonas caviae]WFG00257.1 ATP-binding protein [Aeromonas caviae]WVM48156.1 ATP-binding protein [Aeromonas hydrophila]
MKYMDRLYNSLRTCFGKNTFDFIDLESPVTDTTFKTKKNSFVTIVRIDGFYKITGVEEFEAAVQAVSSLLKATFKRPGNTVQWVFDYDKKFTEEHAKNNFEPVISTCRRLGVDMDDIYEEQVKIIKEWCTYESLHLALWTHRSAVDEKVASQEDDFIKGQHAKHADVLVDAPSPFYMETLLNVHEAFVASFVGAMQDAFYRLDVLEVHDAAHEIRRQIEPDACSHNWRPILWGDKILPRSSHDQKKAISTGNVMLPRLDKQISKLPHDMLRSDVFRIGETYYTSLSVDIFPSKITDFQAFISRVQTAGIRIRVSFTLNNGIGWDVTLNSLLNTFLGFAHSDNKYFKEALAADHTRDESGNKTEVSLQIVMVIKNEDESRLRKDISSVIKFYQLSGEGDLVGELIDPSELHLTSAIGTCSKNAAVCGYPTHYDAAYMLPLMRSASFWPQGGIAFRNKAGKAWYWQPGSGQQESQIDLIIAQPRQGKSVLSNCIQKAFCLKAGNATLPYCITFDIGKASFGFVDLLRDSLPETQKHLALSHTLVWDKSHSMNPLDIQLGLDRPHPKERQDIITFLMLFVSEPGETKPREGLNDFVSALVDETYRFYADYKSAKEYNPRVDDRVDKAIASDKSLQAWVAETSPTWYEVRDELFKKGLYEEANYAQLQAVPILLDLSTVATSSALLDRSFGDSYISGNLVNYFSTKLNSVIRDYPIFQGTTKVDFANARVIALDLQAGAGDDSHAGVKRTALTVLSARYHATRHLFLKVDEDVKAFSGMYKGYQERRLREIADIEKRITYDEFHFYSRVWQVVFQIERDQRIVGKANMQLCIITHSLSDLSDSIISNSTNKFVLGAVSEKNIEEITTHIGLSKSEEDLLRGNFLHGPKKEGASLLYKFDTKDGKFSQFLRFSVGPIELWGYSTTNQDRIIRQHLYDAIGRKDALRYLAKKFPTGTAMKEIERRMFSRVDEDELFDEDTRRAQVATILARDLLMAYKSEAA